MTKVRMKVLREFARNLGGQIVTGHPDHPDENGRILFVSESVAATLEEDGDAKRYSHKDEAREELARESGQEPDDEHQEDDDDDDDVDAVDNRDIPGKPKPAQKVREARVSTTKKADGGQRRKPRKGVTPAPTGGSETNASTNHGKSSTDSQGQTAGTNAGANADPDDDAAPTS